MSEYHSLHNWELYKNNIVSILLYNTLLLTLVACLENNTVLCVNNFEAERNINVILKSRFKT